MNEHGYKHRHDTLKWLIPFIAVLTLTVDVSGRSIAMLCAATLLALTGFSFNRPPLIKRITFLWWLGIAFLLWNGLTLLSLPPNLLGERRTDYFNKAYEANAQINGIIKSGETTAAKNEPALNNAPKKTVGRLTLNAAGTRRFLIMFAGAWTMFWLSTAMNNEQRMKFLTALLTTGAAVAAFTLWSTYVSSPDNRVWRMFNGNASANPGSILTYNHYTSFCAFMIPVAISLIMQPDIKKKSQRHHLHHHTQHKLRLLFKSIAIPKRMAFIICLTLLVAAILSTPTRGTIIMMMVGSFISIIFWLRGHPALGFGATMLAVGLVFLFLLWPQKNTIEQANESTNLKKTNVIELQRTREALKQWNDFKYIGAGAESFKTLNCVYRIKPTNDTRDRCGNEYAQILADHGIVGAILATLMIFTFIAAAIDNFISFNRQRKTDQTLRQILPKTDFKAFNQDDSVIGAVSLPVLAASSGIAIGLLFHCACDCSLRTPMNAFIAASMLGLAIPPAKRPTPARRQFWFWRQLPFIAMTALAVGFWHGRPMRLDDPDFLETARLETIQNALVSAPSYWLPWMKLTEQTSEMAFIEAQTQMDGNNDARENTFDPYVLYQTSVTTLQRATQLNPTDAHLWSVLADTLMQFGGQDPIKIENALARAAILTPAKDENWNNWLDFILQTKDEKRIKKAFAIVSESAASPVALRIFTKIHEWAIKNDKHQIAAHAIEEIVAIKPKDVVWLHKKAQVDEKNGDWQKAIATLEKIVEIEPENWEHWLSLGQAAMRNNLDKRASSAFTEAMRLRPELRDEVEDLWRKSKLGF